MQKISKMLKIGICNTMFCCRFTIAGTITRETENKGGKNKIEVFEEENKDISWNENLREHRDEIEKEYEGRTTQIVAEKEQL